jgi:hypothetical protein
MDKHKRKLLWGGVLALGVLAFGAVWFLNSRSGSLERQAANILRQTERGDASLYENGYEHERKALGLTPDKVKRLYHELVLPRFAKYKPVGDIRTMVNRSHSQAVAWRRYENAKGQAFDLNVSPWATPEGGRQMLLARLQTAWVVQYRMDRDLDENDPEGVLLAKLEGLAADRKALERIGIPGMVGDSPDSTLRTWDECESDWLHHLQNVRKERQLRAVKSN